MSSLMDRSHFQSGMRELVNFAQSLLESQTDNRVIQKVQSHVQRASQYMTAATEVANKELKSVDNQSMRLVAEKKKMEDEKNRQNQQLSYLRNQLASSKSLKCSAIKMAETALKYLEVLNQQAAANMFILNGGCCCLVALNAAANAKKEAEETLQRRRDEAMRYAKETHRLFFLVGKAENEIAATEKRNKSTMSEQHSLASRQAEIICIQDTLRKCVHFLGLLAGKVGVADTLCRDILVYEELEKVLEDILRHVQPLTGQGHAGGVMVLSSDEIRGLIWRLRSAREGLRALTSRQAPNAISYSA